MENKKVSVIIPTYKRPETLARAVNSALSQTYSNVEVIVVDDNNPDSEYRISTEQIMLQYSNNERVKYIKHEKNKNGSAARNTGFRASSGDYLTFLDDDDEYLPEKIEAQVAKLESLDLTWGCCYCNYVVKKHGKVKFRSIEKKEGDIYFDELCRNFFHGGGTGPMVRRSVYEAVGGFDESFKRNQDIEFMLKISKRYKVAHVNIIGYVGFEDVYKESVVTYEQVLSHYIDTFKDDINALTPEQKTKFHKVIALQTFKNYLSQRNLTLAFKALSDGHVGMILMIRYLIHLLYRGVFRVGCSFNA